MTTNNTNETIVDELADSIVDDVMNREDITRHAVKFAEEQAGTKYFTSEQMEAIEGTPQYDLYWSEFARFQTQVMLRVAQRFLGKVS